MQLIEIHRDKICNFCGHSEYRDPATTRQFYRMQGKTNLSVMVCSECFWQLRVALLDAKTAAASDLYAAAVLAHEALLERKPGSVPGGADACEALRLAIAKARGE